MVVKRVSIKKFTVFDQLEIDVSPGINVILGANSTGKSHLLKLIYAMLRAASESRRDVGNQHSVDPKSHFTTKLMAKLIGVFRPDELNLGRLVRLAPGEDWADLKLNVSDLELHAQLPPAGGVFSGTLALPDGPAPLFLPAREVLTMYEGFVAAYENRELSFDETYYDVCKALGANPLKGPRARDAAALIKPLSGFSSLIVRREGDRFYVQLPAEELREAHLIATGFCVIACLFYLIRNGSITKGTVLFWDEPEASLNPRMIKVIADFLLALAASGIQIFIATHDYLLTNELSQHAEYQTDQAKAANLRFFGLSREPNGPARVESGSTLADLDANSIMEEYAALYERERALFYDSARAEVAGD